MSTILDALRKLQRERAAANPSRDLRGSVTDEIPLQQPRGSAPRRGRVLALGALAAALVVLLAVGGLWLYPRSAPEQSAVPPEQVVAETGPGLDAPASDEELDALEREMAADPPPPNEPPAQVAASPPEAPPELPATQADEAAAERARLEEVRRAAAAAEEARKQAEASAEADAAVAASAAMPPSAPMIAPPAPRPVEPAPARAAVPPASAPPPSAAAPPAPPAKQVAAKKAPAKPKVQPKAKPAPARAPDPEYATADSLAPVFPEVRVESIRWHPIAERRAASLRLAQQNADDAHEGDIIGGVLVYRIEPGAVELRVGSTSRVVRPSP